MAKKATKKVKKASKSTKKTTKRKARRKVTPKKKVNTKVMNLFVYNPDSKCDSNLEVVKLETKYRLEFVKRFGTVEIPSIGDFEHWKESLTSEVPTTEAI